MVVQRYPDQKQANPQTESCARDGLWPDFPAPGIGQRFRNRKGKPDPGYFPMEHVQGVASPVCIPRCSGSMPGQLVVDIPGYAGVAAEIPEAVPEGMEHHRCREAQPLVQVPAEPSAQDIAIRPGVAPAAQARPQAFLSCRFQGLHILQEAQFHQLGVQGYRTQAPAVLRPPDVEMGNRIPLDVPDHQPAQLIETGARKEPQQRQPDPGMVAPSPCVPGLGEQRTHQGALLLQGLAGIAPGIPLVPQPGTGVGFAHFPRVPALQEGGQGLDQPLHFPDRLRVALAVLPPVLQQLRPAEDGPGGGRGPYSGRGGLGTSSPACRRLRSRERARKAVAKGPYPAAYPSNGSVSR